ncbi:MAG TPA: ABC transporter ATP-binding protein [Fimbriimonas sp.]
MSVRLLPIEGGGGARSDPLVASGITKRYEGRPVLSGVDLELRYGESIALLGPSGSGKSTLLAILGTLERPDSGSLNLGGFDLLALEGQALDRFRARSIGFVFQEHHLLAQLTAYENALLPTLATGENDNGRILGTLERLGLKDRMHDLPARLSGGERQRVALARALANDPPILLCDEPTGNLDRKTGDALVDLLLQQAKLGKAVLVVTHNEDQAARFDRVLRLEDGRL